MTTWPRQASQLDARGSAPNLRKGISVQAKGDSVDSRRARLQLQLLKAVLRAARPGERAGMAQRASAILQQVAIDIRPEEDPELANLLDAVRAEIQGTVRNS